MNKQCKGTPPAGKICNPKTGRWVSRTGAIGKGLMYKQTATVSLANAKRKVNNNNGNYSSSQNCQRLYLLQKRTWRLP